MTQCVVHISFGLTATKNLVIEVSFSFMLCCCRVDVRYSVSWMIFLLGLYMFHHSPLQVIMANAAFYIWVLGFFCFIEGLSEIGCGIEYSETLLIKKVFILYSKWVYCDNPTIAKKDKKTKYKTPDDACVKMKQL